MVWFISYSSLEAVDWSLYKFGNERVLKARKCLQKADYGF